MNMREIINLVEGRAARKPIDFDRFSMMAISCFVEIIDVVEIPRARG